MRILWNGIGPWHRTGYGVQTAMFLHRLRDLGHHVVLGVMGGRPMNCKHPDYAEPWRGIDVLHMAREFPGGRTHPEFGLPGPGEIREAFGGHDPDLVIVLKDAWVLTPAEYKRYNTAVWTNLDTERDHFPGPDLEFFHTSGCQPVATSRHGQGVMRQFRLDPVFVPHAIAAEDWAPAVDKAAAKTALGLPAGAFVAGINAQNTSVRKAFAEQFQAFARFHMKHPAAVLLVHTNPEHPEGMNLRHLAADLGIEQAVRFGAHMVMKTGQMRSWYQALDVLMNATYGEGFGLPIVEALACGIPVIGTRNTAVIEKVPPGAGWLAGGQRLWVPPMQGWWTIPNVKELAGCLERAWRAGPGNPDARVQLAAEYDADWVTRQYWKPAIERLMS